MCTFQIEIIEPSSAINMYKFECRNLKSHLLLLTQSVS